MSEGPGRGAGKSIMGGGGGGRYSYIHVHRLYKQLLSTEMNDAEHEFVNICPQLSTFRRPWWKSTINNCIIVIRTVQSQQLSRVIGNMFM